MVIMFFFKQKTAYEMRISDWSSDVCSSDLAIAVGDSARDKRFDKGAIGGRRLVEALHAKEDQDDQPAAVGDQEVGIEDQGTDRSEERRCRERVCQYV